MMLLQAISVIFGLFMLYIVRIHRRKRHIEAFEYGVWIAIWMIFIFVAIFPQTFQGLTQQLRIARVFDLIVIVALMIIVYLTFNNHMAHKQLEKKLEQIVRKNAIHENK